MPSPALASPSFPNEWAPPDNADLATPLGFLRYYDAMMRLYVHNRINWIDVRATLRHAEQGIKRFAADAGTPQRVPMLKQPDNPAPPPGGS